MNRPRPVRSELFTGTQTGIEKPTFQLLKEDTSLGMGPREMKREITG